MLQAARISRAEDTTATIIGVSRAIRLVRERIEVAARCDEPVLVVGETGTGKELVARSVHALSRRGGQPLATVNCAAISAELISSELFGHVAGAFTGASRSRKGRLRAAAGSSIFLDEICSTPNEFQVALLRAVEYGEIQPVGADVTTGPIDTRYIAASSKTDAQLREGDGLRRDLYYRLAGVVIEIEPLRQRRDDVMPLAQHFIGEITAPGCAPKELSLGVVADLMDHDFPGNVRELRQRLRSAAVAAPGRVIRRRHLGLAPGSAASRPPEPMKPSDDRDALHPLIRQHLLHVLCNASGNLSECARCLEIPRSTLQHYLTKYEIDARVLRESGLANAGEPWRQNQ